MPLTAGAEYCVHGDYTGGDYTVCRDLEADEAYQTERYIGFAVIFRVGTESHDVYTYGDWMALTIVDPDVWTFSQADLLTSEFIREVFMDEDFSYYDCWQVQSISRV